MRMTLYIGDKNLSSWSLRAYLALAVAGADRDDVVIPLDQPTTKSRILAVNPAGRVPVLHCDEVVIADSLAICEYAAEIYPAARLWPDDRAIRARARSVAAEMHSGFAALRQNMPMNLCASLPGVGHTAEALADATRIQQIWRDCRAAPAAAAGPFLFGAFTIADAMFAPVCTRFATYAVPVDAVAREYMAAIEDVPAMAAWRAGARREVERT